MAPVVKIMSPTGYVYEKNNFMALVNKQIPASEDYHKMINFILNCKLSYAMLESPTIYCEVIKEIWTTAVFNSKDKTITFTLRGNEQCINCDTIEKCFKLPENNTLAPHIDTDVSNMLISMDYALNATKLGDVRRMDLRKEWSFLCDSFIKMFSGKVGPELVRITNEKVEKVKESLKESRSRQKSYADQHRKFGGFELGDHVFLKVSPCKGVKRFGMKGKLSPRYVGPFDVMEKVGEVSYRVALPPQLSHVHNVFHVSVLWGYKYHLLHVVQYPLHKIREDLSCEEEDEAILAREERVLRKNTIPFVKVLWKNHSEREATWELEESIREKYPHLFDSEGGVTILNPTNKLDCWVQERRVIADLNRANHHVSLVYMPIMEQPQAKRVRDTSSPQTYARKKKYKILEDTQGAHTVQTVVKDSVTTPSQSQVDVTLVNVESQPKSLIIEAPHTPNSPINSLDVDMIHTSIPDSPSLTLMEKPKSTVSEHHLLDDLLAHLPFLSDSTKKSVQNLKSITTDSTVVSTPNSVISTISTDIVHPSTSDCISTDVLHSSHPLKLSTTTSTDVSHPLNITTPPQISTIVTSVDDLLVAQSLLGLREGSEQSERLSCSQAKGEEKSANMQAISSSLAKVSEWSPTLVGEGEGVRVGS
ncbi:hypothetical protein AgCh_032029 [Apium graveolens]